MNAVLAETPPRVDGRLDDAVWQNIDPISNFVQRWPVEGAAPTETTWVKIAYDRDYLYFAFKFTDREPELIRAKNMERGGMNGLDDHAYIGLDTFLDGRNAYLFEMNALGTQDDAMIADESLTMDSYSWDAVFRSEILVFNTSYHATTGHEDLFDPRRDFVLNNTVGVAKLTYLIMLQADPQAAEGG